MPVRPPLVVTKWSLTVAATRHTKTGETYFNRHSCLFPAALMSFLTNSPRSILQKFSKENNAEKYTTLLLFFLSKSPGGHVISFQIKPWVAFGLPYLLIELFLHWYSCGPDGRSGGRSVGRSVYGLVITKFCRMGRLPHFLSYGAGRAWSSSITTWSFIVISTVFVESHDCSPYLVHSVEAELESILPLIAVWQKSTYKLELWRNT